MATDDIGSTAHVTETGAGRYQVKVETGAGAFLADEPVASGGLGSGPNPYELLASALGACTAMTLRLYVRQKNWPVEAIAVDVKHERSAPGEKDIFHRAIAFKGPLDAVQRTRLMEIADRCPVHRTFERGSVIRTTAVPHPEVAPTATSDDHRRDMLAEADYASG